MAANLKCHMETPQFYRGFGFYVILLRPLFIISHLLQNMYTVKVRQYPYSKYISRISNTVKNLRLRLNWTLHIVFTEIKNMKQSFYNRPPFSKMAANFKIYCGNSCIFICIIVLLGLSKHNVKFFYILNFVGISYYFI